MSELSRYSSSLIAQIQLKSVVDMEPIQILILNQIWPDFGPIILILSFWSLFLPPESFMYSRLVIKPFINQKDVHTCKKPQPKAYKFTIFIFFLFQKVVTGLM